MYITRAHANLLRNIGKYGREERGLGGWGGEGVCEERALFSIQVA